MEYVLDVERAKKDQRIDTTGANIGDKLTVLNELLQVDARERNFDVFFSSLGDPNPNYFGLLRKDISRSRQEWLRHAVALNMHIDPFPVHIREAWNGKSERFSTTSLKDYVVPLLEKYAVKR